MVGLVLGTGVLAGSSAAVLIRLADAAPALIIAAYRMGLASIVLLPALPFLHRRNYSKPKLSEIGLMVASGAFLALHFGTWISSLQYTSVASSMLLVTSSPVFVSIASWAFLGERIFSREILGIVLGIMGSVLVTTGDLSLSVDRLLGDLLALAGAISLAGYLLLGRKMRSRSSVLTYISVVYPVATLLLLFVAVSSGKAFTGYSGTTYLWLVLIAFVPQVVGHTSLNWVLGHLKATGVAIAFMGEPIGATLLAWLVLQEIPAISTFGGGILILMGVFLALRSKT